MPFTFHKQRINLEKHAALGLKAAFASRAGKPILLLSSGGSALSLLPYVGVDDLPSSLTVGMLDERVSRDPNKNNFLTFAAGKFYWEAKAKGVAFLPSVPLEHESAQEFAARIEKGLRGWMEANPEGAIIATMGIGEDTHAAGIMPSSDPEDFSRIFDDSQRFVAGFDGSHVPPHVPRITVTLPFLRDYVDTAIVFVKGDAKKPALDKALDPSVPLHEAPAGILRSMEDARIFTDSF